LEVSSPSICTTLTPLPSARPLRYRLACPHRLASAVGVLLQSCVAGPRPPGRKPSPSALGWVAQVAVVGLSVIRRLPSPSRSCHPLVHPFSHPCTGPCTPLCPPVSGRIARYTRAHDT